MNSCERCPAWAQKKVNPSAQEVILPGGEKRTLCDKHNPWKSKDKEPSETLIWKKDPRMQGAK